MDRSPRLEISMSGSGGSLNFYQRVRMQSCFLHGVSHWLALCDSQTWGQNIWQKSESLNASVCARQDSSSPVHLSVSITIVMDSCSSLGNMKFHFIRVFKALGGVNWLLKHSNASSLVSATHLFCLLFVNTAGRIDMQEPASSQKSLKSNHCSWTSS